METELEFLNTLPAEYRNAAVARADAITVKNKMVAAALEEAQQNQFVEDLANQILEFRRHQVEIQHTESDIQEWAKANSKNKP